jgi:hypothetical protein
MAGQKMLQGLGREELEVKHPAEREDHQETIDFLGGDGSDISPVGLGLFRRGCPDGEKDFRGGPKGGQVISEDADSTGIAKFFNLLVDAYGAEVRIMVQYLPDFFFVAVELGGPRLDHGRGESLPLQSPSDRFGVEAQLSGNGLLGKFIDMEEVSDGGPGFNLHLSASWICLKKCRAFSCSLLLFPKISGGLGGLDLQNKWTDAIKGVAIAG